jgi:hypothetical protein
MGGRKNIDVDHAIHNLVMDGFGDSLDGEDRFDALVGLYGMINLILGDHPIGEPTLPQIIRIEGWIFGQELF